MYIFLEMLVSKFLNFIIIKHSIPPENYDIYPKIQRHKLSGFNLHKYFFLTYYLVEFFGLKLVNMHRCKYDKITRYINIDF